MGAILEALGAERTSVPFMRVGDIVVGSEAEEDVGHESAMVCVSGQSCLASTREGVVFGQPDPGSAVYSLWEVKARG